MMWQIQPMLVWLASAQGVNAMFGVLCVAAALDLPPRWVAVFSALLYFVLAYA